MITYSIEYEKINEDGIYVEIYQSKARAVKEYVNILFGSLGDDIHSLKMFKSGKNGRVEYTSTINKFLMG